MTGGGCLHEIGPLRAQFSVLSISICFRTACTASSFFFEGDASKESLWISLKHPQAFKAALCCSRDGIGGNFKKVHSSVSKMGLFLCAADRLCCEEMDLTAVNKWTAPAIALLPFPDTDNHSLILRRMSHSQD
ncbi:hypothetical protein SAMN05421736_1289 [Evansella caseinilytica]|uniref:Uncharacterized protein n=1 Tax=Evansella caseinilytica TaxID=1503961 RepID=A0A1H3UYC9_9BACI|nr:hypothetical protein SAMN05421736_1289 [Evansella caseinilytica]